jgi:hypothetical protein
VYVCTYIPFPFAQLSDVNQDTFIIAAAVKKQNNHRPAAS